MIPVTTISPKCSIPKLIPATISFYEIDVTTSIPKRFCFSSNDIPSISGLLNGKTSVYACSTKGICPQCISISIGFYEIDITTSIPKRFCFSSNDIPSISGLLNGKTSVYACSTIGICPQCISISIGFNQPNIGRLRSRERKRIKRSNYNISPINSLFNIS